jgi:hypothetical protein
VTRLEPQATPAHGSCSDPANYPLLCGKPQAHEKASKLLDRSLAQEAIKPSCNRTSPYLPEIVDGHPRQHEHQKGHSALGHTHQRVLCAATSTTPEPWADGHVPSSRSKLAVLIGRWQSRSWPACKGRMNFRNVRGVASNDCFDCLQEGYRL